MSANQTKFLRHCYIVVENHWVIIHFEWIRDSYFNKMEISLCSFFRDFGFGRQSMDEVIQDEFSYFAKMLEQTNGEPVETRDLFNVPVLNGLWRILTGQRLDSKDPNLVQIIDIMDDLFADSGSTLGILGFMNSRFNNMFISHCSKREKVLQIKISFFHFVKLSTVIFTDLDCC